MNQVYCRVLAALVVAAALAACGGSDDEPQRVADEGGLAAYGVESLFSVGVPSDWRTLTADEVLTDEVLETMREADPELGPTLDAIAAPGSPMKLFACGSSFGQARRCNSHSSTHKAASRTHWRFSSTSYSPKRTGYTLTYTTSAEALESRLAVFERSARSFRIH